MKKSLLSALLVCSLTLTAVAAPSVAAADTIDQKIENQDKVINDLKGQQASAQAQIDTLESEVAAITAKAEALVNDQVKLNKDTQKLQKEIADLKVRIAKREEAIKKQARDVQVNGQSTNFIDAVVESDSLTDAIGRVQAMTTIVKANNDLVKQQKADKKAVEDKKAENDKKLAQIQANQAELETQKADVQGKQADLNAMKADLALRQNTAEGQKAGLQKEKQEAEAEQARIREQEKQAEAARKQAQEQAAQDAVAQSATTEESSSASSSASNGSSTGSASNSNTSSSSTGSSSTNNNSNTESSNNNNNNGGSSAAETPKPEIPKPEIPAPSGGGVIGYAQQFIGVPYVWGGKDPSGFDCSGFVGYVYLHAAGRNIGTYTVAQESAGTIIPVSQAQPGDLYFWGSPGSSHHVAIAMGGGQYIHAPQPGQSVSISSVSYFAPQFAVRM
ncbi:C40 family peptidase [Enterococcus sp. SMC-9]|uniref:C40 family peptidase n=1 Tax=Enterococcus sp. SMC-9 TaxID=2862343 RepID=UPI001E534478|nr:NlpC/P60 family protein [Enterococcus sp. SMC-9]MCD1024276.1 C40 family peptidase [Enterococcus sp. SMC-9]